MTVNEKSSKKRYTYALPKTMLSFPHLLEKCPIEKTFGKTEEERGYSATFLLSKSDEDHMAILDTMRADFDTLVKEHRIREPRKIFKDGDADYEFEIDEDKKKKIEYRRGHFYIGASNKKQPVLTCKDGTPIILPRDNELFYPSCYVHAFVEMYGHSSKNDKTKIVGVTFRLHHVQFAKDGRMFGTTAPLSAGLAFDKFLDKEDESETDARTAILAKKEVDLY